MDLLPDDIKRHIYSFGIVGLREQKRRVEAELVALVTSRIIRVGNAIWFVENHWTRAQYWVDSTIAELALCQCCDRHFHQRQMNAVKKYFTKCRCKCRHYIRHLKYL
jgi:hypothetical protein